MPVAGLLVFASAVALARYSAGPAPVQPLTRLRGWDLLAAGLLVFAAQTAADPIWRATTGESPGLLGSMLVTIAAATLAWSWLGMREGSFAPRRHPASDRRLLGWRSVVVCYGLAAPGLLATWKVNELLVLELTGHMPVQGVAAGLATAELATQIAVIALAVGVAPLLEETLCRGFLWRFLAGHGDFGPRRALAFSSLVFAVLHEVEVWLPALYLGGFFGWIYWRSGRLRYAVLAHALHNAVASALLWIG